ncbi:polysaccharide biosynthesis/export family protein [Litorisediminicola beolgyonensis]|uniref:Polysaccharide biosynthesis/export family protein n=1 Tax=Litorisediminicola beolgyonensis TaxID=1173614 RepID=A0ABW3ZIQ3_9RHOB
MHCRSILCLCLSLLASPAVADAYRLVAGDRVSLVFTGHDAPQSVTLDLDGAIRIPGLGGVALAGLTLDAAEARIEEAAATSGLFVSPQATLGLDLAAPVVVAGAVQEPGAIAFRPGLTVAAALALAGGPRRAVDRVELAVAANEARARATEIGYRIATDTVRSVRLEAALSGASDLTLTHEARAQIPVSARAGLPALLRAATEQLATERDLASRLEASWAAESAALTDRITRLDQDRSGLDALLLRAETARDSARALRDQGLTTEAALVLAETRATEAAARMLDIDEARARAERAVEQIRRDRLRFRADQRLRRETELGEARAALAELILRHAEAQARASLYAAEDVSALVFLLSGPRRGRETPRHVTPETPLLPGDLLEIRTLSGERPDG